MPSGSIVAIRRCKTLPALGSLGGTLGHLASKTDRKTKAYTARRLKGVTNAHNKPISDPR
jgi:hypothetical protein